MEEDDRRLLKLAKEVIEEENTEALEFKVEECETILSQKEGSYEIWLIKKMRGTDRIFAVLDNTDDDHPSLYLALTNANEMEMGSMFHIIEPRKVCPVTGVEFEPTKMMMDLIGLLSGNLKKVDQIVTLLRLNIASQSYSLGHLAEMELEKYSKFVVTGLSPVMKILTASLSNPECEMYWVIDAMFTMACVILVACVRYPGTAASKLYSMKKRSDEAYTKFYPPGFQNVTFPVDYVLDRIGSLSNDGVFSDEAVHDPISELDVKFPKEVAAVFGFLLHDDVIGIMQWTVGEDWLAKVKSKIPFLKTCINFLKDFRGPMNPHSPDPLFYVYDYVSFYLDATFDRRLQKEMQEFIYKFQVDHDVKYDPNEELECYSRWQERRN